jgi:dTDP-4-amino-4,6-dideoxygalactose transaminase
MHLSLIVANVKPGDEVITSPMTFAATANVITHVGARPVFVDCEKMSMNLDAAHLDAAITEKTKAIIPVHMAGRPCEINSIQQALHKENIGTGIHFIAVHLHPYYKNTYGYKRGDFPNAEFISDRTISLPLSAKLSDQDVKDVIRAVRKVILYFSK